MIAAGIVVGALSFLPHPRHPTFPGALRVFGLLAVLVPIVTLANWGAGSLLPLAPGTIEHLYQVAGFAVSALVIWGGVRQRWPGTTNLGSTAFAVLLYTKMYDWWWEWMPRWLFFLVVGLVAILVLLVMRRLRAASQVGAA